METTSQESLALSIAIRAHYDQEDRAGMPYIWHPLRIALKMETPLERIVAILHDVVEDTFGKPNQITLQDIHAAFSMDIVYAVDALTRREPGMPIPLSPPELEAKTPIEKALGYSMWKAHTGVKEDYFDYIERAGANPLARKVKFGDLEDNSDTTRLNLITDQDKERLERYAKAAARLRELEAQS